MSAKKGMRVMVREREGSQRRSNDRTTPTGYFRVQLAKVVQSSLMLFFEDWESFEMHLTLPPSPFALTFVLLGLQ